MGVSELVLLFFYSFITLPPGVISRISENLSIYMFRVNTEKHYVRSFIRSFAHSFVHSFIHSFVRSFVHSNYPSIIWILNENKCKVMHIGRNSENFEYQLNNKLVKTVEKEKDLGVIVSRHGSVLQHQI